MSVATKIDVVNDTASPWLALMQGRISPHRIAAEIGPRCTRLVQRNFRKLGANAKDWPSTHFYGRAAEATNWHDDGYGFVPSDQDFEAEFDKSVDALLKE
jgi:hypothetical protein